MKYNGKLYGKLKNKYFDTGKTSDDWDDLCKKAGLCDESAPVDGYDEKCYHECPNCNSRCNCNSQPCSCCSAPVDDVVDLREKNAQLKKRVEELEADVDKLLNLCRRKY